MYQTIFNWNYSEYSGFKEFLQNGYRYSKRKYQEDNPSNTKESSKKDIQFIKTCFQDLEKYYYSLLLLKIATRENNQNILNQFKTLNQIKIWKNANSRCYALTNNKDILINPNLGRFRHMNSPMFTHMIISHELGHIITSSWKKDSLILCDRLYRSKRVRNILKQIGLDSIRYLQEGFELIDEAVCQEAAEESSYLLANHKRENLEYRQDKAIFNHQPYRTNFNLYGEFQEIAYLFAKFLRFTGINNYDSMETALNKLVKEAFSKDFIRNIQKELNEEPEKLDDLIILLACMGRMKEATYQILGLSNSKKSLDVTPYVNLFYQIAKKNHTDTTYHNKVYYR